MALSPLLLAIINIFSVPLGYFFPFLAVWMLIRRLEKGVAEHIASWWFYAATISIMAAAAFIYLGATPAIPYD